MRKIEAEAEISISFGTKSEAEALSLALAPETVSPKTSRARVDVTRNGRVVRMRFYAKDLIAFRALLNSFLRLAAAWKRVCEVIRSPGEAQAPQIQRVLRLRRR